VLRCGEGQLRLNLKGTPTQAIEGREFPDTMDLTWKADRLPSQCIPPLLKIPTPKITGIFSSEGKLHLDPTAVRDGFRGEVQIQVHELTLTPRLNLKFFGGTPPPVFRARSGSMSFNLADGNIAFKEAGTIGQRPQPNPSPGASETKPDDFALAINGEVILRRDVNPDGFLNIRGRINLPPGYKLMHLGLPEAFEDALHPRGHYQLKLSGTLKEPVLAPL
jgi:hypothetical protein